MENLKKASCEILACVASVSVWFRSKERPRNGILGFGRARNETRAKKRKWGEGEGEGEGEGKEGNACRQTPRFWKPAFARERSAWLARLVEQYWHVSIKGLFHTERTVWSPPPPRSFTYAILRAVFYSRSSFLAPKPHGNACYAG